MKNPKTISTTDFYADYAAHLQNATDLAASSVSGYLSDLRFFMAWFTESNGEAFRPAAVTPTDVKQFRTYMQAVRGHKAATINQRLAGLTRFMDWASRAGHVSPNPVAKIEYLKLEPAAPRHLDRKQRLALERQLQKNRQVAILKYPKRWRTVARDAALILFLLNTGLRVGEAVRLRFGDLRLGERSGAAVVQGKGRKQRTVALNRTARAALKEWLGVREGEERPDGYVWQSGARGKGKALSVRAVQRALERIGNQAGIPDLTPHMLRHTFAYNLLNTLGEDGKTANLVEVASLLGHENMNTTRVYTRPTEGDLSRAVERIA